MPSIFTTSIHTQFATAFCFNVVKLSLEIYHYFFNYMYLCLSTHFLQESWSTIDGFILALIFCEGVTVALAGGLVKNKTKWSLFI